DQQGQLVEGVRVGCLVLHGERDAPAGVLQPLLLGLVAAGAGRQDQAEALLGGQAAVVPGDGVRVHHFPLSLRPSSTACSASSRLSSTSPPMARSRASASVAVRRAFSPVGSSDWSTCRSRPASTRTTSPVSTGEAEPASRPPCRTSAPASARA